MLLLLVPVQDERDVVPVDPDARLPDDVRRSLAAIDPAVDGWSSEVLSSAVGDVLHELEDGLARGEVAGLEAHALPDFASRATLRPRTTTTGSTATDTGAFRLEEVVEEAEAVGLPTLLRAWRAAVGGGRVESKVKIVGVEQDGPVATTLLRLELVSRAEGVTQVVARLVATWDAGDEGAPRLAGLELIEGHRSHAPGPLFVDVTAAALGPDLAAQLAPGLPAFRDRLDTRHGVGILGHHGVALGDLNGDGLDDVYLCQPGGLPNRLFLRDEDGTTREVAAEAGVDVLEPTRSALIVDLDGDGARELVVTAADELVIFTGDGRGRFGIAARHAAPGATSMAAADVDGDGDLDLFVCGYVSPYDGVGVPEPYHDAENGERNVLLINQGALAFVDRTEAAGLSGTRFSFACAFEDVDEDGDADLYVANDFGRNRMYVNAGDGTFVDRAAELRVEDLSAGMGVSFADVDGDGRMDLHVANMFSSAGHRVAYQRRFQPDADGEERAEFQRHARGDSLFLNRPGGFVDVSHEAGIGMGRWAWGAVFVDFENDGRPDLYVPNGFVTGARKHDL